MEVIVVIKQFAVHIAIFLFFLWLIGTYIRKKVRRKPD